MKKKIYLAIALFLLIFCGGIFIARKHKYTVSKVITVSIPPLKYVVESITDHDFPVTVLLPPGTSPESYDLTPKQIVDLERSQIIVTTQLLDFERSISDKLSNAPASDIVNVSENIDLIHGTCSHGYNHGIDPHIWISPKELINIAGNIYNTINVLYPDSVRYKNNYNLFVEKMDLLDEQIRQSLGGQHKAFVIYHPALSYYARAYGLEQISLENEGKEPSAGHLKNIISYARKSNIKYILYQKKFNRTVVETVANDMGARPVEIDPLDENIADQLIHITSLISQ